MKDAWLEEQKAEQAERVARWQGVIREKLIDFNCMTVEERLLFLYMKMLRESSSNINYGGVRGIEIQEIIEVTQERKLVQSNTISG